MFVCLCVVCVSPSVLHRSASFFFFFDFSDFRFSVTFCLLYDSRLYSFCGFDCLIDSSTVDALMLVFSFPKEEFYYSYSFFFCFLIFKYGLPHCSMLSINARLVMRLMYVVLYVLCDKTKISHLSPFEVNRSNAKHGFFYFV